MIRVKRWAKTTPPLEGDARGVGCDGTGCGVFNDKGVGCDGFGGEGSGRKKEYGLPLNFDGVSGGLVEGPSKTPAG